MFVRQRTRPANWYQTHCGHFAFFMTACAFFAGVMPALAASEYGGIVRGKIVRAGEPISNTSITLEDEFGQQYAPVFTDRAGMFVITGVKAGKYKVLIGRGDQQSKTEITAGPELTNVPPIEMTGKAEIPKASFALTPSPMTPSSITTDEARTFVKDHMEATQEGKLEAIMTAYAARVNYYDEGVRDREYIYDSQKKYLSRYQRRTYELGAIDVIRGEFAGDVPNRGVDSIRVRFSFRYKLSLKGKPDKVGTASELWVLRKNDGQIQITDCKENVIRD